LAVRAHSHLFMLAVPNSDDTILETKIYLCGFTRKFKIYLLIDLHRSMNYKNH